MFDFGLFVLLWFVWFGLVVGFVDGAFMLVYDYCLLQMLVLGLCWVWWLFVFLLVVGVCFVTGLLFVCFGFVWCFCCYLFCLCVVCFDMIVFCWCVVWQVVVFFVGLV